MNRAAKPDHRFNIHTWNTNTLSRLTGLSPHSSPASHKAVGSADTAAAQLMPKTRDWEAAYRWFMHQLINEELHMLARGLTARNSRGTKASIWGGRRNQAAMLVKALCTNSATAESNRLERKQIYSTWHLEQTVLWKNVEAFKDQLTMSIGYQQWCNLNRFPPAPKHHRSRWCFALIRSTGGCRGFMKIDLPNTIGF